MTKSTFDQEDGFYFVPLGGSEQFGVNLNAYICNGKILIVDCGIGFADERFPGIDLLLPDPTWLEERKDRIQGVVITHAHEDHVGAMPYLYERFGGPIYCSAFTGAVLKTKFKDAGVRGAQINIVDLPGRLELDDFALEFLPVAHSIPEAFSTVIETDYGKVLHSGDWNLDPAPVVGAKTSADLFRKLGKENLLAYIGDSTNAEVDGRSGSESDVAKGLEKEFQNCKGKIVVTTFSSNIGRIVSIAKAAKANDRRVVIVGRSLHRMVGAAYECGYLQDIPDFISEEDAGYLPDDKIVFVATGSQGEHRAALGKISRGEHYSVKLKRGDTVIFSSRSIPGNEKNINGVKNNLSGAGVNIMTPRDSEHTIHISGHPARDEIAEMLRWIKPQCVIAVHGEHTQIQAHAAFARTCQIKNTIVPNNGSVIRLDGANGKGAPKIVDTIETGLLAVEEKRIIKADHAAIGERRKLQYSGAIHASLVLDSRGELLADPHLDLLGMIDEDNKGEGQIIDTMHDKILDVLEDMNADDILDDDVVCEKIRIGLRRFSMKVLGMKPNTTVHVTRV